MDDKANGSVDTKSPVENGQMPDPANWGVADVVNYFKATGFEEQATAFQDQVGRLFDIHGQVMFKKQKTQVC
uniref:SAM domain-containing protein n=1 Tax=Cynoglossus semilaevis TaxID=244447 RepID=A0A3P8VEF2_CYNSE